jgi:two-component system phosphate regulon sensor histidine kinase PhoR
VKTSRISVRISLATGLSVAIVSALLVLIPELPLAGVVAGGSIAGAAAAYLVTDRLHVSRLRRAAKSLAAIRAKRFEALKHEVPSSSDEIGTLLTDVHATGRFIEAEIQTLQTVETFRRDFVGNVSHELKTPIFAIKGFAETLLAGALDDHTVKESFVRKILQNADRLDNLARDLSEITRIETGEQAMLRTAFGFRQLVGEAIESLEARAEGKGIAVRVAAPENMPDAFGDRDRIGQVLVNLIDNAIKYSNEGDVVTVALTPSNESIRVAVIDTGIGIPAEHIGRLTERFYRVDKSRSRSQGGTGLGLSIVKHILGRHGAELKIESVEGQGSTFAFTIATAF